MDGWPRHHSNTAGQACGVGGLGVISVTPRAEATLPPLQLPACNFFNDPEERAALQAGPWPQLPPWSARYGLDMGLGEQARPGRYPISFEEQICRAVEDLDSGKLDALLDPAGLLPRCTPTTAARLSSSGSGSGAVNINTSVSITPTAARAHKAWLSPPACTAEADVEASAAAAADSSDRNHPAWVQPLHQHCQPIQPPAAQREMVAARATSWGLDEGSQHTHAAGAGHYAAAQQIAQTQHTHMTDATCTWAPGLYHTADAIAVVRLTHDEGPSDSGDSSSMQVQRLAMAPELPWVASAVPPPKPGHPGPAMRSAFGPEQYTHASLPAAACPATGMHLQPNPPVRQVRQGQKAAEVAGAAKYPEPSVPPPAPMQMLHSEGASDDGASVAADRKIMRVLQRCMLPLSSAGGPKVSASLTAADLQRLFMLPIDEARSKLRMSKGTFSKVMRRCGYKRWPQRQLAGLINLMRNTSEDNKLSEDDRKARLMTIEQNIQAVMDGSVCEVSQELSKLSHIYHNRKHQQQLQATGSIG